MSKGKTTRFNGSRYAVQTSLEGEKLITAASQTKPIVVTAAAHGYDSGDVVRVSGLHESVDATYAIKKLDVDTFELVGSNGVDYVLDAANATAARGVFTNICELTSYSEAGDTRAQMPTTTICSDDEEESEPGMRTPGTLTLQFNSAPATSAQQTLLALDDNTERFWSRLRLTNGQGLVLVHGYIQTGIGMDGSTGAFFTSGVTIQKTPPVSGARSKVWFPAVTGA
ncbi:phage tail tube protein [Achromobacter spanius]